MFGAKEINLLMPLYKVLIDSCLKSEVLNKERLNKILGIVQGYQRIQESLECSQQ
jgi:hypothetical protein